MKLSTKIAYNTIVQVLSKIIATVLGLASVIIMARSLGVAGFGEYTTIITFLSFFGISIDFGLTLVTSWMISQPNVDEKKVLANLFTLRFFSALIFLGISPFVVLFFPYSNLVKLGVGVAFLSFFFISLSQILVGFFQTKLRMDKVSIAEVIGRIILLIGIIISVKLHLGLIAFMIAIVISSAVSFFIQFFFANKLTPIRFSFDFSLWRKIIKKSWPFALTIVFNLLYLKMDIFILSLIKGKEVVGVYGATYKVVEVLTMLPFMFSGIILPILTANWAKNNKVFFNRVLQKSFDLILILIVPLIVGTQFLANAIMTTVMGDEFYSSGGILRILIIAVGLVFVSCLFSHVIIAVDKQKQVIGAYFFTAITATVGYLVFIPKFSYFGAAAVTIYSELAITLFMMYYLMKFIKFLPTLRILPKVLFSSFIMGGILYLIPNYCYGNAWGLIVVLMLSCVSYFVSLYLVKGISKNDLYNLLNRK